MAVLIDNRQTRHKLQVDKIRQTAQDILDALDCPDRELSILLVDDPQIEILNTKYLNRRKSTNVIAFPMQEGKFSNISPALLGDVAVSIDTAVKEGEKAGIGMEERLTELLVHGILHLLGYDHENNKQKAEEMERKTEALLKQFESTAVQHRPFGKKPITDQ